MGASRSGWCCDARRWRRSARSTATPPSLSPLVGVAPLLLTGVAPLLLFADMAPPSPSSPARLPLSSPPTLGGWGPPGPRPPLATGSQMRDLVGDGIPEDKMARAGRPDAFFSDCDCDLVKFSWSILIYEYGWMVDLSHGFSDHDLVNF